MDKKTVGLIATIGTALLCACPSFFLCVWGILGVTGTPIDTTVSGQTTSQPMAPGLGFALLCLSLIGILIPVAVGFFTLRKKDEDGVINAEPFDPPADNDPLPPVS
ncbi:MAG: hypothetical protein HN390_15130 [Anaerolineae bacterium]|jgi:hypothetical protein|nr:hypothetical protein [Anaerolineae bacterium]MBT7188816.1 hypothetical protein [Anaerolineae bacterium]MBT7989349.1 hypothetical protein [Anaerolineae bacterium]